jgi:hypothetical protein
VLQFQWDDTRSCSGWYWEEEYVTRVEEYLAKQEAKVAKEADESASVDDEAVSQQKKLIDDLSVLVGIGRKILLLLKCIVGFVCLVLFGIVYIVSRL